MRLRESINQKPWLGWAVAAVLFCVAALFALRSFFPSGDIYSGDSMSEMVTIKFTDTGETMEIPRGRLIKQLLDDGGTLDPSKGIMNPKTKQPTGFLFNKSEWESMIKSLIADRAEAKPVAAPAGK